MGICVFMKYLGMFAFKDEIVKVGYHSYDSIVALYEQMLQFRQDLLDGGHLPLFCEHHERYLKRVHSHNLAVRVEVAKWCCKVSIAWQCGHWSVAFKRILYESDQCGVQGV
jgi:hypothetical protein